MFGGACSRGLADQTPGCRRRPLSGPLFVFVNRRRDRLKILVFEGDGYALYYKRLEAGTHRLPAGPGDRAVLSRAELAMLLEGVVPLRLDRRYGRGGVREKKLRIL